MLQDCVTALYPLLQLLADALQAPEGAAQAGLGQAVRAAGEALLALLQVSQRDCMNLNPYAEVDKSLPS